MALLEDLNWRHAVKAYDATKKVSKENIDKNNNIETDPNETVEQDTKLLLDLEIKEVIISKSEGSETTVTDFVGSLKSDEDLKTFKSIMSSAIKEEGKVKMMNPEFDLEIIYEDEIKQKLYLWLGRDGQISSLMDTENTMKRYSISEEATYELINLMKALY